MFMMLTSWLRVIVRVHPVHAMNAEQRQTAADLLDQADGLEPLARRRHLLLLSPKADAHFTVPQRVEGWVDLDGWLHTCSLQSN